jgi:hypothetical protein
MAPCKSKGQPTFGISGSLKAAIERNKKVDFWVRVWHCVFTIEAHSHWSDLPPPCPDGTDEAFWLLQQQMAILSLPPLSLTWLCMVPSLC